MKKYKLILGILCSGAGLAFLFQNCSRTKLESASGVMNPASILTSQLSSEGLSDDREICVDDRIYPPGYQNLCETKLRLMDSSVGNGTKLITIEQKIQGAGAGLMGCTGPISNYDTGCKNDSEFQLMTKAWGSSSYNQSSDIYSTVMDVSSYNWPFTKYFTRFILSDGTRTEVIFEPSIKISVAPEPVPNPPPVDVCIKVGKLQWVFTDPDFCVGPTPAPAPIGQSCSSIGEKRTNPCGTATCQVVNVCQ